MIQFLDEQPPVSQWVGGSLAHLGQNPFGQNLWRVVWSESVYRMYKHHSWPSFKWIPSYTNLKCYVLERWIPGEAVGKCGPEIWNLMGHADELGPFPTRGIYFGPCWEFSEGYPTLGAVEKAIELVAMGDQFTDYERTLAVIQAAEREDQAELAQARDIILESLPLDVTRGKLTNRFYQDAENIPEKLSAQDISKMKGLPYGQNKAFTAGARRTEHADSKI